MDAAPNALRNFLCRMPAVAPLPKNEEHRWLEAVIDLAKSAFLTIKMVKQEKVMDVPPDEQRWLVTGPCVIPKTKEIHVKTVCFRLNAIVREFIKAFLFALHDTLTRRLLPRPSGPAYGTRLILVVSHGPVHVTNPSFRFGSRSHCSQVILRLNHRQNCNRKVDVFRTGSHRSAK
jgi:hypothetical protein